MTPLVIALIWLILQYLFLTKCNIYIMANIFLHDVFCMMSIESDWYSQTKARLLLRTPFV